MSAVLVNGGRPEVWAGAECTVNRVGVRHLDQLELSGHARRVSDLDLLAGLGISALRFPLIWERTAPHGVQHADWSWCDARLARLRELGVRPIAGLVHHGSGPLATNLLDPSFPARLAEYAAAAAERYPFIEMWTPINESVTTARFSCLYGHWYPHARDIRAFTRALIHECQAVVQAMAAIRSVIPHARLVQTEDLGRIASTPSLAYQAEYENLRRLLGLDLLTGKVQPDHPLWTLLRGDGAAEAELAGFMADPCPPDIIGMNYYLTSDRFLDERLERYPALTHGGNGRDRYADVEAVRVAEAAPAGHESLLRELWERYRLPLAITEVHMGCTREQQLRWALQAWRAACDARASGVDVRAVTAWAAFGSYDWNQLVTRLDGFYEPGLFDVRGDQPRPTALAHLTRALARDGDCDHPAAQGTGWWQATDRVLFPPIVEDAPPEPGHAGAPGGDDRPVLVAGAGTLGRAFERIARERGLACKLVARRQLDIADADAVHRALDAHQPWAVINAAGYVNVDAAQGEPDRCFRENVHGPVALARACRSAGIPLVTFSSDLVFNGRSDRAYVETDAPDPLGVYGRSKAEAERRVLATHDRSLVVRAAAFFGPWDEANFVVHALRRLLAGQPLRAASDLIVSPTYVPDLVHATLDLLTDGEHGIWHVANPGALSWADLARAAATRHGLDATLVEDCGCASLQLPAPRPAFSALASARGQLLRPLDQALAAMMLAFRG